LFLKKEPLLKPLNNHPEFEGVIKKIETRFWKKQEILEKQLENKGLV
jgi:hypothetical protein